MAEDSFCIGSRQFTPKVAMSHSMSQFFDNYLTYISVGLPKVEVFATACEALSIVDERKDRAGITSHIPQFAHTFFVRELVERIDNVDLLCNSTIQGSFPPKFSKKLRNVDLRQIIIKFCRHRIKTFTL
jgi:hypothetical protein